MTGGSGEQTYLGTWRAPNLTPDDATGIGKVTDAQLARMIRYGVNRDGHIGLPFMDSFADVTEADLVAILSFLRSLPPAPGVAPSQDINLLGKIALTYFIDPYAPATTPLAELTPEASPGYGALPGEIAGRLRRLPHGAQPEDGEVPESVLLGRSPVSLAAPPGEHVREPQPHARQRDRAHRAVE